MEVELPRGATVLRVTSSTAVVSGPGEPDLDRLTALVERARARHPARELVVWYWSDAESDEGVGFLHADGPSELIEPQALRDRALAHLQSSS